MMKLDQAAALVGLAGTVAVIVGCGGALPSSRSATASSSPGAPARVAEVSPACGTPDDALALTAALPASGAAGGCTIALGGSHYQRSWAPREAGGDPAGPDKFSPLITLVEVQVECPGEATTHLRPSGWILARGERTAVRFERAWIGTEHVDPWDGAIPAGGTLNLVIVSDDGPFLPAGTDVQVAICWTADDGAAVLLGAPAGVVRFAS